MPSPTKPRLELRRWNPFAEWEWWGKVYSFAPCFQWVRIGSARYLTVEDAMHIYRSLMRDAHKA